MTALDEIREHLGPHIERAKLTPNHYEGCWKDHWPCAVSLLLDTSARLAGELNAAEQHVKILQQQREAPHSSNERTPSFWLGELLAVIHGDGGHYRAAHGNAKATEDAITKYHAARAALRELLRLKDLKTDAEAIETSGSWNAVHRKESMLTEYRTKKSEAWDAARRAMGNVHETSAPLVDWKASHAIALEQRNRLSDFIQRWIDLPLGNKPLQMQVEAVQLLKGIGALKSEGEPK